MTVATKSEYAKTQSILDDLPAGSVVLDRFGHAWQQGGAWRFHSSPYWYRSYGDDSEVSSYELSQRGPLRAMTASKTYLHRQRK